jgi:hypothetical protein
MATVIGQTEQKAKKIHHDDGSQYFDYEIIGITEDEIKEIEHSKNNKWQILPGEVYVRQVVVDGGDFWVYKSRKYIFDITSKYRLFDDF